MIQIDSQQIYKCIVHGVLNANSINILRLYQSFKIVIYFINKGIYDEDLMHKC